MAKLKVDKVSGFVKVELNVPQGLWNLLDRIQPMTGAAPKQYLEGCFTNELECILGNLDSSMFDLKLIRTTYGEGSRVSN